MSVTPQRVIIMHVGTYRQLEYTQFYTSLWLVLGRPTLGTNEKRHVRVTATTCAKICMKYAYYFAMLLKNPFRF